MNIGSQHVWVLGLIHVRLWFGAGANTRLESRIKKFTPHCACRYFHTQMDTPLPHAGGYGECHPKDNRTGQSITP